MGDEVVGLSEMIKIYDLFRKICKNPRCAP